VRYVKRQGDGLLEEQVGRVAYWPRVAVGRKLVAQPVVVAPFFFYGGMRYEIPLPFTVAILLWSASYYCSAIYYHLNTLP
jgi:hypothetical protein